MLNINVKPKKKSSHEKVFNFHISCNCFVLWQISAKGFCWKGQNHCCGFLAENCTCDGTRLFICENKWHKYVHIFTNENFYKWWHKMFKNNMCTQYKLLKRKIQLLTYYLDITEKRHKLRMMAGRLKKNGATWKRKSGSKTFLVLCSTPFLASVLGYL